jgi:hypothetical protein
MLSSMSTLLAISLCPRGAGKRTDEASSWFPLGVKQSPRCVGPSLGRTRVFVQMQSLLRPSQPGACLRRLANLLVALVHFGSDLVGEGVVQLLENCQCPPPGDPGGRRITKGSVGVAEGDKGVGFAVTLAELPI